MGEWSDQNYFMGLDVLPVVKLCARKAMQMITGNVKRNTARQNFAIIFDSSLIFHDSPASELNSNFEYLIGE